MLTQNAVSSQLAPMPELGRLKAAAERIRVARHRVECFVERFHGPTPADPNSADSVPTESYRNDLESVFCEIDRLESIASSLDGIG